MSKMTGHKSKQLINTISIKTGLNIKEIDISKVEKAVNLRIKALKLSSDDQYERLLNASSAEAQAEWKQLIPYLTTGESFFFRDKGQISILNKKILPDLIEKKRTQKELRVWSAGCSTGEEPYTLAIMLDQLIPYWDDWKIHILATDMTETALNKAKDGLYSDWSFRDVDADIKNKYFEKKRNKNWQAIERIRNRVTFELGNLILDDFPSLTSNIHSMDLIICRNVFIYHKRESVFEVVQKFSETLVDNGYLLVGHSELYGHHFDRLKTVSLKESVFYQKLSNDKRNSRNTFNKIDLQGSLQPKAKPPVFKTNNSTKINQNIKKISNKKEIKRPIVKETKPEAKVDKNFEEVFLKAQSYANKGDYEQALSHFKQAEDMNPFSVKLFYFWGHLEMDQENLIGAKEHLKKAIYLDASFIPAYFDLANIYEMDNDEIKASKMKQTTLKLLKNMDQDATIELLKNAKASELIQYLES